MRQRIIIHLIAAAAALGGLGLGPAAASAQFQLGLQDPGFTAAAGSTTSQFAYNALNAIHGSTVRVSVGWAATAPGGATRPAGFDAADPADPHYNWARLDATVIELAARHDQIVLNLTGAPPWAQPAGKPSSLKTFFGAWDPSATEYGLFAKAAALRYSGSFVPTGATHPLPRVRKWEIWNEENLPEDLMAPNLVAEYRSLLNAAYASIKSVSNANTVAVGGLAPVSFIPHVSVSPLAFAAQLMCLRRVRIHFVSTASCPVKAHFDALAIHPYSLLATPTKHAYNYDDILVGDLGKLHTLLTAAKKLNTVVPRITDQLWTTEWSWFTNPPDPTVGDRDPVAARYTAYSMYEMWRAGVNLVIWFLAQDPANVNLNSPSLTYGGGLYTATGKPKLMMQAYTFPVIASVTGGRGYVWGRAPVSTRTTVTIQEGAGHGWKRVGTAHTGSDGIFQLRFPSTGNGTFRAIASGGATSLGYNSRPIPAVRTHT
jgi:hypothetical protein